MNTDNLNKFFDSDLGTSITIKKHIKYKCLSSWEPDWIEGTCFIEDSVTTAGNNHHPHAKKTHSIGETRINAEVMKKIQTAILQILKEEKIIS
jgi:hypothetical protein